MKKRKFHAYLYEYEDSKKQQNCGYIKAELNEEKEIYSIYLSEEKSIREIYLIQCAGEHFSFKKVNDYSPSTFSRTRISFPLSVPMPEDSSVSLTTDGKRKKFRGKKY